MQIASEPRMPRGTSRCGLRVSSAVVATMSKPMKAKNTSAAAAKIPLTPKFAGACPKSASTSVASSPAASGAGSAGGMNGL